MSAKVDAIANRILGARIVAVEEADGLVRLDFEHRGTDDDSGYLLVPASFITFEGQATEEQAE